ETRGGGVRTNRVSRVELHRGPTQSRLAGAPVSIVHCFAFCFPRLQRQKDGWQKHGPTSPSTGSKPLAQTCDALLPACLRFSASYFSAAFPPSPCGLRRGFPLSAFRFPLSPRPTSNDGCAGLFLSYPPAQF